MVKTPHVLKFFKSSSTKTTFENNQSEIAPTELAKRLARNAARVQKMRKVAERYKRQSILQSMYEEMYVRESQMETRVSEAGFNASDEDDEDGSSSNSGGDLNAGDSLSDEIQEYLDDCDDDGSGGFSTGLFSENVVFRGFKSVT